MLDYMGTIMGVIKGNTLSLDYGSFGSNGLQGVLSLQEFGETSANATAYRPPNTHGRPHSPL